MPQPLGGNQHLSQKNRKPRPPSWGFFVYGRSAKLVKEYTYDAINRLLTATGREKSSPNSYIPFDATVYSEDATTSTSYTETYVYDKMCNIESLTHNNSGASYTRNFGYVTGKNINDEITIGGTTWDFYYDAKGNKTQRGTDDYFEFDAADQLKYYKKDPGSGPSVQAHYLYSGGVRIKKMVLDSSGDSGEVTVYLGGFEHRYVLDSGAKTDEGNEIKIGAAKLKFGDTMPDDTSEAVEYYVTDHLGSSSVTVSDTGSVLKREEFTPYGETSFGSYKRKRYRFCGKELDAESGLYYYGLRYYAAWTCRFINIDPLWAKYPFYTPYQYAGCMPINCTDLDGAEPDSKVYGTEPKGITGQTGGVSRNAMGAEAYDARFGGDNFNGQSVTGDDSKTGADAIVNHTFTQTQYHSVDGSPRVSLGPGSSWSFGMENSTSGSFGLGNASGGGVGASLGGIPRWPRPGEYTPDPINTVAYDRSPFNGTVSSGDGGGTNRSPHLVDFEIYGQAFISVDGEMHKIPFIQNMRKLPYIGTLSAKYKVPMLGGGISINTYEGIDLYPISGSNSYVSLDVLGKLLYFRYYPASDTYRLMIGVGPRGAMLGGGSGYKFEVDLSYNGDIFTLGMRAVGSTYFGDNPIFNKSSGMAGQPLPYLAPGAEASFGFRFNFNLYNW